MSEQTAPIPSAKHSLYFHTGNSGLSFFVEGYGVRPARRCSGVGLRAPVRPFCCPHQGRRHRGNRGVLHGTGAAGVPRSLLQRRRVADEASVSDVLAAAIFYVLGALTVLIVQHNARK